MFEVGNLNRKRLEAWRDLRIFYFPFPLPFLHLQLTYKSALFLQLIAVIHAIDVPIADESNGYALAARAAELLLLAVVRQSLGCK